MSARAGFGGAVRSELTKIRSVRSTCWTLVAMVLVTVLVGVLTFTSEYSTGMIRASLTAQPRRSTLFAAKATAFTIVSLTAGLVAAALPESWQASVSKWIPFNAGSQVWSTVSDPSAHMFSPWAGLAVFAGYAVIAMAVGLAVFLRRDA